MIDSISDSVILNNGIEMPWLGLGLMKIVNERKMIEAVNAAFESGYRSLDTASYYNNEREVGEAIKSSGMQREEIFITTKVWNDEQGYESTLSAFERSRKKLGLDYVDLYLVHWPVTGIFHETWKACEKLYHDGYIRAIGVSNFQIHHLKSLLSNCKVKPVINQVEYHPRLTQKELRHYCNQTDIQMAAWGPLMRGRLFENPTLTELSQKYEKTIAQIILRWDLQNEIVTIPKSEKANRIKSNAKIFDFEIESEDMVIIDGLNTGERTGPHPDLFV
ncbi:oxidoreductase [Halalkalibacter wakoensis JCM 9140]|uniref:Oxidoreductase n=1 Tax=Halalkalibacter wakoensis JCM 9140 TaxID=1236970 RepID=W4Q7X9_9BACI|nr:aldo/keto reductase [Halalkalibacter wakoensis]GAE28070.1 oxidoreductase [Halalkalibacter wakoensis JCM 9140]